MKTVEYREFSRRLHDNAVNGHRRVPVNVSLDLTHRCNNRCVHCYCRLPSGDERAISEELSTGEIENLFDSLRDMGCLWLLITGGEPLLRPDFTEIYLSAKRHGFLITLFTNATLVNEEIACLLEQYPPFFVEVTMYGATLRTYEKVTGVPGSYERYWSGVRRLLGRNIKLKLKAVALTLNCGEIHQMCNIARGLGCEFRFDPVLQKRIDGAGHSDPVQYRLAPDDVVKLELEFPERIQEYREFCSSLQGQPVRSGRLITCGAGEGTMHIMPGGAVLPCQMLIDAGRSIRKKPLQEIWETDFQELLDRRKDFTLKCDKCLLQGLCGQCAGWSLIEYGTVKKEVKYLCDIALRRAKIFPFLREDKEVDNGKETVVET